MAQIKGTFQETNIATIAAMITLIDAFFTAENARMIVLGGVATNLYGTITLTVRATNGAGATMAHRISVVFNCPLVADTATLTAALSVFATAVETESAYTTVTEVDAVVSVTLTN